LFSKKQGITIEVVMPFVVLPPIGILWGAWLWWFLKRKYDKMLADGMIIEPNEAPAPNRRPPLR